MAKETKQRLSVGLLFSVLLAITLSIAWQTGWADSARFLAYCILLSVLLWTLRKLVALPRVLSCIAIVALSCMWAFFLNLRDFGYDILAFFLAITIAASTVAPFRIWRGWRTAVRRREALRFVVTFVLAAWIITSARTWNIFPGPKPLIESRPHSARAKWESGPRVGLTLSGGGFRAALLHAGVLRELDEYRIPIRGMSTVSGGSIIGAYYCAGGDLDEFEHAVATGRFNLKRELADCTNVVRMALSSRIPGTEAKWCNISEFSRLEAQSVLLKRVLFGARTMKDLRETTPALMICSTNLVNGELVGTTPWGVVTRRIRPVVRQVDFINDAIDFRQVQSHFIAVDEGHIPEDAPLSDVVAASGAFPGAFNAYDRMLSGRIPCGADYKTRLLLADGGITDNLGLRLMREAVTLRPDLPVTNDGASAEEVETPRTSSAFDNDIIVVSDGSAAFVETPDIQGLDQVGRAIDVIYANAGAARPDTSDWTDLVRAIIAQKARQFGEVSKYRPQLVLLSPSSLVRPQQPAEGGRFQISPNNVLFPLGPTTEDREPADRKLELRSIGLLALARDRKTLDAVVSLLPGPDDLQEDDARTDAIRIVQDFFGNYEQPDAETELLLHEQHPLKQLHRVIRQDLAMCLEAFYNASTLDDQPNEVAVSRIYRLGRYLVRLNAYDFTTLRTAKPPQSSHLPTAAWLP